MGGTDGRDPTADFRSLRSELKLYNPDLAKRPYRVVANKMDEPSAQKNLAAFKRRDPRKAAGNVRGVGRGGAELKAELFAHFSRAKNCWSIEF